MNANKTIHTASDHPNGTYKDSKFPNRYILVKIISSYGAISMKLCKNINTVINI